MLGFVETPSFCVKSASRSREACVVVVALSARFYNAFAPRGYSEENLGRGAGERDSKKIGEKPFDIV